MIAGDQFETDLVRPSCIGIRLCCRIRGRIVSRWLGPGLEPGLFHLQRVSVYSLHNSVTNIVPIKLKKTESFYCAQSGFEPGSHWTKTASPK